MKKLAYLSSFVVLSILQSCEEKPVLIDMGLKEGVKDTTYLSTVETAQNRNVLIEEFTGASCTNCPAGHDAVSSLINDNPGRIVAVAYHTFNGGQIFKPVNKPNEKSKFDFRDNDATQIGDNIFGGLTSIPAAGIDRAKVGTSLLVSRIQWSSEANKRLTTATPVNMSITSSYSSSENKVSIKIKASYTKDVATKQTLNLGVIESKIIDAQEFPDSVQLDYEHNHIFRKALTPFNGYALLDSIATKQAGRVYEYTYVFTPDAKWNLDNCYIVAYISNNVADNKEVLQAKEVKLK